MKKLILLIALVGCGTDVCPAGSKMGAEGHCIGVGGAAGMSTPTTGTSGEPTTIGEPYDSGISEAGRIAVGGSGGKSAVDAGEPDAGHDAEASGGRGGEGGGSAGQLSLPSQTAGAGGSESGSGGAGGRQVAGGSPTLDSGVPTLDAGQIEEPPRCGDSHKDPGELCDGDCPTSCDDSDPCTKDALQGSAMACNAVCSHTPITKPANGDMCCPAGANSGNDNDCPVSCGNGVIDHGEVCDGNCPTSCPAIDACHPGTRQGSPQMCNVTCVTSTITAAKSGDGCCPDGANANNDSDCAAVCGNGVKEAGEACDGDCPTSCPSNGCTVGTLSGSGCNVTCTTTTITDKVNGDGCCPATANFNTDSDCAAPPNCSRESATNLLTNPGFATGTTGWDISGSYGTVGWSSGDYEGCSVSGSALLTANNQIGRIISQCVPASGGTYYFSVRIKSGGNGGQVTCAVAAYQIAGCQGQGKAEAEADWLNVAWGPEGTQSFTVDNSFQSLYVGCYLNAQGVEQDATAEVDQVYLGTQDAAF